MRTGRPSSFVQDSIIGHELEELARGTGAAA